MGNQPSQADVVYNLRQKSKKLISAAARLKALGRYSDATPDEQEGLDCKERADGIEKGTKPIQHFPSQADIDQLSHDCDELQSAIDKSASANDLAAAADKVKNDIPASSV